MIKENFFQILNYYVKQQVLLEVLRKNVPINIRQVL